MNSSSIYQEVTDKIIRALEEGVLPWKQPWVNLMPQSVCGRPYRGINLLLLGLKHFADPRWITFRKALELGGHVRKGERAATVTFWKFLDIENDNPELARRVPLLKAYNIFNVEQVDGLDLPRLTFEDHHEPIERAEQIIRDLPWELEICEGKAAYWSPSNPDSVTMPPKSSFDSVESYYSVLLHEISHASGHASRLDRDMSGIFGDPIYGFEELVAQICSAFLCCHAGITNTTPNDAAYISGWLKTLKNDPKAIVRAAGQAQRAADYLIGRTSEIEPKAGFSL